MKMIKLIIHSKFIDKMNEGNHLDNLESLLQKARFYAHLHKGITQVPTYERLWWAKWDIMLDDFLWHK